MVVDTRGLRTVEVFNVGMLRVGLSVGPCPRVAHACDTNWREYFETGDLRGMDDGVRLASTGIIGVEWRRGHFERVVEGSLLGVRWGQVLGDPCNRCGRRS